VSSKAVVIDAQPPPMTATSMGLFTGIGFAIEVIASPDSRVHEEIPNISVF
jgi:hypothetical protein